MMLELKRPIAFFDLEATGTDVAKDRIIEIFILKVFPDGTEQTFHSLVNPQQPLKKEVIELTGLTDEQLAQAPTFDEIADRVYDFIKDCDLAGFNSNRFDVPLLVEEFLRVGINFDPSTRNMVDVQVIYHKMERRDLSAAYKFYCGKELKEAHSAEADTRATYEILLKQIEHYSDTLDNKIEKLAEFSVYDNEKKKLDFAGFIVYDDSGEPIFNFGKYKGKKVKEIFKKEPQYFDWMMKSNFPLYTKKVIEGIMLSLTFDNVQIGKRKLKN